MKRKIVRLTESELHSVIENSVRRIIKEEGLGYNDEYNGNPSTNFDYDYSDSEGDNDKIGEYTEILNNLQENGETDLFRMIYQAYDADIPMSNELIELAAEKMGVPYEELKNNKIEFEEAAYSFI